MWHPPACETHIFGVRLAQALSLRRTSPAPRLRSPPHGTHKNQSFLYLKHRARQDEKIAIMSSSTVATRREAPGILFHRPS